MSMMNWHIVSTKAEFKAGFPVETDLYFIADTHEIYRGSENYSKSIEVYTGARPEDATAAIDRLYIDSVTLKGEVFNGTSWATVLKPMAETIEAEGHDPVTGSAVTKYVAAEIAKIGGAGNIVTNITWDEVNHILDVFKGENKQSITFDGLAVSMQYAKETGELQLIDASNNPIGDPINLDLEKFVTGGEYDAARKVIILYFDGKTGEASTDKVEIPVGDLVDVYTGEQSQTATVTVEGNKIKADVRISLEGGNALIAKEDGLYVNVPDVSNKMDKVESPTDRNILITDASGQAVDSGLSIDLVREPVLYQGTTTPEEVAAPGTVAKKGDVCIITKEIGEGTGKFEKTAYECDGSAWVACDGNYSAKNVFFSDDLKTTFAIGNINLTNGQGVAPTKGKNLEDSWNAIFLKEKNPTVTQPTVSISMPQAKAYEVGTTVTPSFTAALNAGKYEFGPATAVTAKTWAVRDTEQHQVNTNTGSFDAFVVGDTTDYSITATATYDDGAVPNTNVGNPYPAGQIKAGSKSGSTGKITGFRAGFYGTLTSKDGAIDSALVRSLKSSGAKVVTGTKWNLTVPVGALRVAFAYPDSLPDVSSVKDGNGMDAEIKTAFTKSVVKVEGANAYTAIDYKVYVMDLATANDTANTYKITL